MSSANTLPVRRIIRSLRRATNLDRIRLQIGHELRAQEFLNAARGSEGELSRSESLLQGSLVMAGPAPAV
jgi:hypothetical protein